MRDRAVRWLIGVWLVIGLALVVRGAWQFLHEPLGLVLPGIVLATLTVYLLEPVVGGLRRRGVPRLVGTMVAYVAAAALLLVAVTLLTPVLVAQTGELVDRLPDIAANTEVGVNNVLARLQIPDSTQLDLDGAAIADAVRGYAEDDGLLGVLRGAGAVVAVLTDIAITAVLAPIIAFYALVDLPRLKLGAARLLPPRVRDESVDVASRIGRLVGSYFRGQLLVALFVGTATSLGLYLVGLPFWALVGVVAGVFNLVPLVGPFTGGVLGVLVALTVGDGVQQAVLVLIVMVAVQQVDNHVITPLIVSRSVAVHPITVIIALIIAGALGGIPLMFVAIPVTAVIKLLLVHVAVTRFPSMQHLAHVGEGPAPRRSSVAALATDLRSAFDERRKEVRRAAEADADDDAEDDAAGEQGGTRDGSDTDDRSRGPISTG